MYLGTLWINWTFLTIIVTRGYGKYIFRQKNTFNVTRICLLSFYFWKNAMYFLVLGIVSYHPYIFYILNNGFFAATCVHYDLVHT